MIAALFATAMAAGTIEGSVTLGGKSIGPTIVYVRQLDTATPATSAESTVNQKDVEFKPGTLVVLAGTTVHFPNLDKVWHNVFSLSTGNEFDLGLYRGGTSQSVQLISPGSVEIYCNIHPDMAAHVLVLQNPLFDEVNSDGSFKIENVPPGEYEVVAWERTHTPIVRRMLVADTKASKMNYALVYDEESMNHLNKHNEIYGRYK